MPEIDPDAAMRGASAGVLLRLASGYGNRAVVEALLARGADPSIRTRHGSNAIDIARKRGHPKIAELLERGQV